MDLFLNLDSPDPFCDLIRREVKSSRRNVNIMVTGKTQSRKTTLALNVAERVDPDFDISTQMAIGDPRKYLEVLKAPVNRRGEVRMLDEVGTGINHRQFFSFMNKAMSFTVQTYGFKGLVTIFVAPFSDLVDKDIRKFFDYTIEIMGKDDKRRKIHCKIQRWQYNQDLGKVYHKHLFGTTKDKKYYKVTRYTFGWPKKETLDRCMEITNVYKEKLLQDLEAESRSIKEKSERKAWDPRVPLDKILKEPEKYISVYNGKKSLSLGIIKSEFGVGSVRANHIKDMAKMELAKKGML